MNLSEQNIFLKLCDSPNPKSKTLAFFTVMSGACSSLRIFQPAKHMRHYGDINYHATSHYTLAYPDPAMPIMQNTLNPKYEEYDTFLHQRESRKEVFEILGIAKKRGIRQIYEIDDDLLNVPKYNPYYQDLNNIKGAFKYFFHYADVLTCTTEPLKEVLSTFNKNVRVIPNAIDFEFFDPFVKKEYDKEQIVIGWAGTPYHLGDLLMVEDVITDIVNKYDNVRLLYGGNKQMTRANHHELFKDIPEEKMIRKPWVTMNLFPEMISGVDIAVLPLEDNMFNRSKSNLKYLQFSALGIPCVASDVYPYQMIKGGDKGFVVPSTYDAWYQAIEAYIENAILRKEHGRNARTHVKENYDQANASKIWHDLLIEGK